MLFCHLGVSIKYAGAEQLSNVWCPSNLLEAKEVMSDGGGFVCMVGVIAIGTEFLKDVGS